jgi:hypothetical protein
MAQKINKHRRFIIINRDPSKGLLLQQAELDLKRELGRFKSASLIQTVPPKWTARPVSPEVLPEQTLSGSVLSSAERVFLAGAVSLAVLLVAAVLPAGAVSLALLVVAGMQVSMLLFDAPQAGLPEPMRVASLPGAAVHG